MVNYRNPNYYSNNILRHPMTSVGVGDYYRSKWNILAKRETYSTRITSLKWVSKWSSAIPILGLYVIQRCHSLGFSDPIVGSWVFWRALGFFGRKFENEGKKWKIRVDD